jgi:hypothetical protein
VPGGVAWAGADGCGVGVNGGGLVVGGVGLGGVEGPLPAVVDVAAQVGVGAGCQRSVVGGAATAAGVRRRVATKRAAAMARMAATTMAANRAVWLFEGLEAALCHAPTLPGDEWLHAGPRRRGDALGRQLERSLTAPEAVVDVLAGVTAGAWSATAVNVLGESPPRLSHPHVRLRTTSPVRYWATTRMEMKCLSGMCTRT